MGSVPHCLCCGLGSVEHTVPMENLKVVINGLEDFFLELCGFKLLALVPHK